MVKEEPSSIAFLVAMLADATSPPKALLIAKVRQPGTKSWPPSDNLLRQRRRFFEVSQKHVSERRNQFSLKQRGGRRFDCRRGIGDFLNIQNDFT
jgi:hypothetical protein